MAVTEVSAADRTAVFAEVDRLTQSTILHGSEALCKLLRYLAEHFAAEPGTPVKEYQLATEVFGRPRSFDPRLDSTVRVQTGRLRSKLAEYFAGPGAHDPVVLEIPKGSYSLAFHYRPKSPAVPIPEFVPAAPPIPAELIVSRDRAAVPSQGKHRKLIFAAWTLGAISLVSVALLVVVTTRRDPNASNRRSEQLSASPLVRQFWAPFISTDDRPWVIFSNAEFVGRPTDGIRYFDPARDSGREILDHYTGVGEVLAVAELTRTFTSLDHPIRIKRGRLFSLDDLKTNDVIFVGSPSENLTLREISTTQDFLFRRIESGPERGDVEIANMHVRPGEPKALRASPDLPITVDYGVIALVPSINPNRSILVLAGTTTLGTQGAVEFVCREDNLRSLMRKLSESGKGIRPFEALIEVRISGGVPVQSRLLALHTRAAG